jgi:hypothetical protein
MSPSVPKPKSTTDARGLLHRFSTGPFGSTAIPFAESVADEGPGKWRRGRGRVNKGFQVLADEDRFGADLRYLNGRSMSVLGGKAVLVRSAADVAFLLKTEVCSGGKAVSHALICG